MGFRNKKIIFLVPLFLILFLFSFFAKPLILSVLKKQLNQTFVSSQVSLGNLTLKPWGLIAIDNISITRENAYTFSLKELKINYNLFSLLKKAISGIYLKDLSIEINIPDNNISEFNNYLKVKLEKAPWIIKTAKVNNSSFSIKSRDLSINARLTLEADIVKRIVNYLNFHVVSLEAQGLKLNDALCTVNIPNSGDLHIAEIIYDKINAKDIKARAGLNGLNFFLKSFSAKILGGVIEGELVLSLDKKFAYFLDLTAREIDLQDITQDLKLEEKFKMSGRLRGNLKLKGEGFDIKFLSGAFALPEPGGILTIKDKKFLENLAKNSGQSLEILIESFQNYRYNIGRMGLKFENGNLLLNVALEGETGKRNLSVTVHDFKLGRGSL